MRAADESVTLSRFEQDLRMAQRAAGTIQLYSGSLRRFEDFVGVDSLRGPARKPSDGGWTICASSPSAHRPFAATTRR